MNNVKLNLALLVLLAATIACVDGAGFEAANNLNHTPQPSATETLIPAFVATSQSAVAGAQATTAYGQAQMSELSVRATQISLELTAAAATEQHAAKQTADVRQETQRAYETASAQATQVAENALRATQTAVVQAGLDAAATADAVRREAENAVVVANASAEVERIEEQRQSERQTALFRTWGYRVFWSLLAVLVVVAGFLFVQSAWQFRVAIMVRAGLARFGADGKIYLTVPLAGGGVAILDPARQFGPALAVMPGGNISQPGIVDVPLQAQVTARAQAAELLIAANTVPTGAPRKNPLRTAALGLIKKDMEPPQPAEIIVDDDEDEAGSLPLTAPWELLQGWQGQTIPLGVGKAGPLLLDPLKTPHLLIAATSGGGKTMCGLRPITAAALARGQRVILLNDAGGDFAPLLQHPNLITADENPTAVAEALESVAVEVDRRSAILRVAGVSTWSRLNVYEQGSDDAPIMVVVDELVALTTMAAPEIRRRIWAAVIAITSKGRKMGISFVGATTDPTYRTLGKEGLVVRDNCGRMAFRMRDGSTSQAMFDARGAEGLSENQFLAMFTGEMTRGVAFHPSDDELRTYIQTRPVTPLPEWRVAPGPGLPVTGQAWSRDIIELANAIKPAWLQGASKNRMARSIDKEYAGAFCRKLDQAIEYLEATTTTTDVPAFGE